jgi:glucosamine 6-phosphate synthetase-like amidotransferase/phosphosugar isomerase protein
MCGIFGYIATPGQRPNMRLLEELALWTMQRGRDAFGLAWIDQHGGVGHFKRPGSALANLDALDHVRSAVAIIGHCRYATNGDPRDNDNNHPHPSGDGWLVHNGTVRDHHKMAKRRRIELETECDSELVAKLVARGRGKLLTRAAKAFEAIAGPQAVLGLYPGERRMLVARRTKPLHFTKAKSGVYLASLPNGMPGNVRAVLDGWAGLLAI